jgi:hypothetical protein
LKTGGWSILLSMLDIDKKPEQQEYAAWAIGTAVKNSYDFQLWLLESDLTHPSELILKTNNKKDKNYNENKNKFEYKIDIDGKNDLTGKLNTGIGKDFSFDNDNHDIQNQNDINNYDTINDKSDKNKNKNNNDNNKNNKLSLIPVTQNLTIAFSKNQNNSNVNNNNKNENIQKSMTGIEKLVSLLYYSTNNESFIMRNRPNLDELQRKVLYAISAAARGNVDVQESLLKIVKSDFNVIKNGDINKNESSSVGGKVNIDQSVFMNYLIKIAEQSNRNNNNNNNDDVNNDKINQDYDNNNDDNVSYELTRKIWTFIADMLEERAYIRGDLSLFSDLPEKAKEELSNLVLMGDFFLTEFWFNLAEKTFERIFHSYTVEIAHRENLIFELNVNGEIIDKNDISQNTENTVSTDSKHVTLRSIAENILVVEKEILSQHEILKLKLKDEYKQKLNSIVINDLENYKNEGLIEKLKSLLEILA